MTAKRRKEVHDMFGGRCAYCGHLLQKGWHGDHVEPLLRKTKTVYDEKLRLYKTISTGEFHAPENNRPDNIYPSCPPCNIDKAGCILESFRAGLANKIGVLRRSHSAFRLAERYELLAV